MLPRGDCHSGLQGDDKYLCKATRVENRRLQKMLMDVAHLNLKIVHIPGIKNCTADFRSRRPRDTFEAVCEQEVPIKLRLGVRTVRAERMML